MLLPLEGPPPPPAETTGARGLLPEVALGLLERYHRALRPTLTFQRTQVAEFLTAFGGDALILNVGGGSRDYGPNVLNLDIAPGPRIGIVAVAERLPFADASFGGVILQAVLEHVVDEGETLAECARVLRPQGKLLVEAPFIQGYHADPGDYRRYTEGGLRQMIERHGLHAEASGVSMGPASAFAWVLAEFLALLVSFRSDNMYRFARLATTFVAWPLKFLDRLLDRHPKAHVIASEVWVVGRKIAPGDQYPIA